MRRLIIERSAIRSNMAVIRERAQGAALYGVVSGQGGGVGAVRLARLLRDAYGRKIHRRYSNWILENVKFLLEFLEQYGILVPRQSGCF